MVILQNIGVDWKDRKLIWNLYNKQVAYVRIEDGLSTARTVVRGVRQGCYRIRDGLPTTWRVRQSMVKQ